MTLRAVLCLVAVSFVGSILGACGGSSSTQQKANSGPTGLAQLSGTFAFSANGTDPADGDYFVAGSITADGKGGVTGIEDLNLGSGVDSNVPFTGTYQIDSSNNVLVTLSDGTGTPTIVTFPVPSASSSVKVTYNGTATGTLQTQASTAFSNSGSFNFTLNGEGQATVMASGSFTLGAGGAIAKGSEQYQDGTFSRNTSSLTGVVGPAFSQGRGTAVIGSNLFSYYVVSANQIILAGLEDSTLLYGTASKQ